MRAGACLALCAFIAAKSALLMQACGDDDPPPPPAARSAEQAGRSCKTSADCYVGVDAGALSGAIQCLQRVTGGYCTHLCKSDADCCAVPGECVTGVKQVCSPFESTDQMMCFLSCEAGDLRPAPDGGVLDDNAYCATYAAAEIGCRSSGGGNKNRKVCVP